MLAKLPVKRIKNQTTDLEKIFAIHISNNNRTDYYLEDTKNSQK